MGEKCNENRKLLWRLKFIVDRWQEMYNSKTMGKVDLLGKVKDWNLQWRESNVSKTVTHTLKKDQLI